MELERPKSGFRPYLRPPFGLARLMVEAVNPLMQQLQQESGTFTECGQRCQRAMTSASWSALRSSLHLRRCKFAFRECVGRFRIRVPLDVPEEFVPFMFTGFFMYQRYNHQQYIRPSDHVFYKAHFSSEAIASI